MCRPEITFWKPRPEKNSDPSSRTRLVATDADFPSPFFPLIQNCEKQLGERGEVFISRSGDAAAADKTYVDECSDE